MFDISVFGNDAITLSVISGFLILCSLFLAIILGHDLFELSTRTVGYFGIKNYMIFIFIALAIIFDKTQIIPGNLQITINIISFILGIISLVGYIWVCSLVLVVTFFAPIMIFTIICEIIFQGLSETKLCIILIICVSAYGGIFIDNVKKSLITLKYFF